MKRLYFITAILCCALSGAYAQKQSDPLPYNKEKLDSLFDSTPQLFDNMPKRLTPLVVPTPEGGYTLRNKPFPETPNSSFETNNPGATIINKTSRGTIYNMPSDNMAVLVPDMNTVENMPGSNRNYKVSPQGNMPNPLAPKKKY